MIIEYDDIKLRAIEETDLDLLHEMINDPEIESMTGGGGFPVSKYQQSKWFETIHNRQNELRLIIDTLDHGAIGQIFLTNIDYKNRTAELHSKIASSKNVRGRGYGTKAYKGIIDYAFNYMNLNCIYALNIEYNTIPEKLKIKLGFVKEGVLRERVFKKGKYYNQHVWSLLKQDWISLND